MRVGPIVQRLQAMVPAFTTVAGAPALALALKNGRFDHSAYVFQSSINGGANTLANKVQQTVPVEISIAYWVRDVSDPSGQAMTDAIEDLREQIVDAMLGWVPAGEKAPFLFSRGDIISSAFGVALWCERYKINTYLRNAA